MKPPAPKARATSSTPTPSSAPEPRTDGLAAEAALLERARAALRSGPAQALAVTEEHLARFPSGQLSLEREILAIDALMALGRSAEARARFEAIRGRVQGSPFEARLRKLLEEPR